MELLSGECERFGTLLGYAPGGVAIYSSDYKSLPNIDNKKDISFRSYIGNEYMGYKWQCVEFARRFLYLNYGTVFSDVGMAYEVFSLRFLRHVVDDGILPLKAFVNGSPVRPTAGALLIWDEGGEFKITGHIAIITQVYDDKVRIVEQNVIHHKLPIGQQWTRELPLKRDNGGYTLSDTFPDTNILGWMIQTDSDEHAYSGEHTNPELLKIHAAKIDNKIDYNTEWLNKTNPIENKYIQARQDRKLNSALHEYFTISSTAENKLIQATNEVHLMYLHATEKVLKNDELLKLFNIPELLWPRIRLSWKNRRHDMITGRLDFCLDERGLKVYEYNADSASCHTEAGVIIDKWAKVGKLKKGKNPSGHLNELLSSTWEHSSAKPFIHIMQDVDSEEDYHSQYMACAITEAGFDYKIIHGLDELFWNETGQVVDSDGRILECVWKTWAWETALEQIRQECEKDYEHSALQIRTGHSEYHDYVLCY